MTHERIWPKKFGDGFCPFLFVTTCDLRERKRELKNWKFILQHFQSTSFSRLVPLLAKVGHMNGVGGKGGRGGLVTLNNSNQVNAFKKCASGDCSSHRVMKALMEMNPPLFKREDVSEHELIHCAAFNHHSQSLEVLELYIDLDHSSLFQKDSEANYPINYACGRSIDVAQFLLKRALKYNPHHYSIGALVSKCEGGIVPQK